MEYFLCMEGKIENEVEELETPPEEEFELHEEKKADLEE